MINRRFDLWPRLLSEYLDSVRTKPFTWGEHDCCLFTCNCIQIITGLDPAAEVFRGKYSDLPGAMSLLNEHGGVEAIAVERCAAFGFAEIQVAFATRGDVLLVDTDNGPTLGICWGSKALFVGPDGLESAMKTRCRRAWRVQ